MKKPGMGFVWVCLSYVCCFAFFAWGSAEPTLETLWHAETQLKEGQLPNDKERQTLWEAFRNHPQYPEVFLGAESGRVMGENHFSKQVLLLKRPGAVVLRLSQPVDKVLVKQYSENGLTERKHLKTQTLRLASSDYELVTLETEQNVTWEVLP